MPTRSLGSSACNKCLYIVCHELCYERDIYTLKNRISHKMVASTLTAVFLLSLTSLALATCNYGTSQFPREHNVPVGTFGYNGLDGPLNWFGLNESANSLCATGRRQSPIDLDTTIMKEPGSMFPFKVQDYPQGSTFENLGTTVEVPANGTLHIKDKVYKLAQFHYHTPSEHRIELEYFPMEMHMVFEATGRLSLHRRTGPGEIQAD